MKLSISNIAWTAENDNEAYSLMQEIGFTGLEIAPTRIFPNAPYSDLYAARMWAEGLKERYGFIVPSMQSIWYGRQELIFGMDEERKILIDYTKKAIDFAEKIGCRNLVFGCPKNRNFPADGAYETGIDFFREIGEYAFAHNTVIGMEANPVIYNTNYINTTKEAIKIVDQVGSKGFMLNLDLGTMIYNSESIADIEKYVGYINHVHISEPGLKVIEKRDLHIELLQMLGKHEYCGFISIEMGGPQTMRQIEDCMRYVKNIL